MSAFSFTEMTEEEAEDKFQSVIQEKFSLFGEVRCLTLTPSFLLWIFHEIFVVW